MLPKQSEYVVDSILWRVEWCKQRGGIPQCPMWWEEATKAWKELEKKDAVNLMRCVENTNIGL